MGDDIIRQSLCLTMALIAGKRGQHPALPASLPTWYEYI